jgi:hypothetical protein
MLLPGYRSSKRADVFRFAADSGPPDLRLMSTRASPRERLRGSPPYRKSQSGMRAASGSPVRCAGAAASGGNVTSNGGGGGISVGAWPRSAAVAADVNENQSGTCGAMCSAAATMWSPTASGNVTRTAGKEVGKCSTARAWSGRVSDRAMLVLFAL